MRTSTTRGAAITFSLALVTLAALAGCSMASPPTQTEATASSAQHEESGECGDYQKRQCDPNEVVSYYENDVTRLFGDVTGCAACGGVIAGSAIVAIGGTIGSDGLLTVPSGALAATLAAGGCVTCWKAVEDSGLMRSLDCALEPCVYSVEARTKECQQICSTQYAWVGDVSSTCQCTDNATEARCRVKCYDGDQLNDQCGCDPIPTPPPPPPAPECSDSGDGYSCSVDPDTQRDRLCCHNQCVIWECSACDDNPYCPGR